MFALVFFIARQPSPPHPSSPRSSQQVPSSPRSFLRVTMSRSILVYRQPVPVFSSRYSEVSDLCECRSSGRLRRLADHLRSGGERYGIKGIYWFVPIPCRSEFSLLQLMHTWGRAAVGSSIPVNTQQGKRVIPGWHYMSLTFDNPSLGSPQRLGTCR
jgi:hypothetical protein